jgi:hypothetical protein
MNLKKILPDFPRTMHLNYKPNAQRLDLIAAEKECKIIFESDNVDVTEKCDGAQVAINYHSGNPIIRNRNNLLNKVKTGHLRTAAKMQFSSIFNWFYDNINKFEKLNELAGFEPSVYAEWMIATHSCRYDKLSSYFIAFDLYDWEKEYFMNCNLARQLLENSGFIMPPLLYKGKVPNYDYLEKFMNEKSEFSTVDKREGIYIKVCDKDKIIERFKWVRKDFIQGEHWNKKVITKNKLEKD